MIVLSNKKLSRISEICHLEHVFCERSFTPSIAERFTYGELASSFRNDKI